MTNYKISEPTVGAGPVDTSSAVKVDYAGLGFSRVEQECIDRGVEISKRNADLYKTAPVIIKF